MNKQRKSIALEKFDDVWSLGYPREVEKELRSMISQAKIASDTSVYLQILSQIALAQALQKKFEEAHKTLDDAESFLCLGQDLAQARILLERGRVYHQSENFPHALTFFKKAFTFAGNASFSYQAIDAAHMIAIVSESAEEKIAWNLRAIEMAGRTKDARARLWVGSLYNNLGQSYLNAHEVEKALVAFKKALVYRKKENYVPNIRVAKWAIAHALRLLDRLDESLRILNALILEYGVLAESSSYDMPVELFALSRGLVYEDLAALYYTKAKKNAALAYQDLSKDGMFVKMESERLERLQQLQKSEG